MLYYSSVVVDLPGIQSPWRDQSREVEDEVARAAQERTLKHEREKEPGMIWRQEGEG
jgi:hypothetical protein